MDKPLLRVLAGEAVWPPPTWLMRQAGRYLPEYRQLRSKAGDFGLQNLTSINALLRWNITACPQVAEMLSSASLCVNLSLGS